MQGQLLQNIQRLYKKSDQLLKSGRFGEGLWPLDQQTGQLLKALIELHELKNGIEIGAGVGYSTVWLGAGFRETKGKLTSFEYFLPKVEQLEKHLLQIFGESWTEWIDVVPADLRKWMKHRGRKKYDFVFFDHRKNDYLPSLQLLIPFLKKGAFVCADNVISHAKECETYLKFLRKDKRFETVTLDIGQGLELSRFLG